MAATRDKYLPPQISERWWTPFITCSLVSWATAAFGLTLGEQITYGTGVPYGKIALKNLVGKAWRAIEQPGDKGYGRTDFEPFMKAFGLPMSLKEVKFTKNEADIEKALDNDYFMTIAGNTVGCRATSPLRKWVGEADHRIAFRGLRTFRGVKQTRLYDPMTPDTDEGHWGRWVPLQDIFDFGKRFKHWGLFLAERFVTGHYTREAKARRAGAKAVLQVQERVVGLQTELIEANETIVKKNATITELRAQLDAGVDREELFLAAESIRQLADNIIEEADRITAATTVTPLR